MRARNLRQWQSIYLVRCCNSVKRILYAKQVRTNVHIALGQPVHSLTQRSHHRLDDDTDELVLRLYVLFS